MTRIFPFDPKARLEEVRQAVQSLQQWPEVLGVVLFGPGRGEATAFSVMRTSWCWPRPAPALARAAPPYRPPGVRGVEVFPYTLEEVRQSLHGA
ncbi:MAG: nucleotidyltransferase domain-containing protein, partial [Thermus sp.]